MDHTLASAGALVFDTGEWEDVGPALARFVGGHLVVELVPEDDPR